MLKRLFCKHEWSLNDTETFAGRVAFYYFGCRKCGKTNMVTNTWLKTWIFEQKHKGAVIP